MAEAGSLINSLESAQGRPLPRPYATPVNTGAYSAKTMTTDARDHRNAAETRIRELIALLEAQPPAVERDRLIEECVPLARAIGAFHMEGIRFRMFNVDRTLTKAVAAFAPGEREEAQRMFADARRHLEAAGFQTRSHQAPN